MNPNTSFQLGTVTLQAFEVPERVPYGGEQQTVCHQLPGSVRIIDVMGFSDRDVTWTGIIFSLNGQEADERARAIDAMRRAGKPVAFTYWTHSYQVLIKSFLPDFERHYQVPYSITLMVVQDNTAPAIAAQQDSADDLVDGDMSDQLGIAQDELEMTVPSITPGPVSTFGGVQITPSLAVTAAPQGNGLNLNALAAGLTAARLALSATSSVSGLSAADRVKLNITLAQIQSSAIAAQASGDTALYLGTITTGNVIGGVVAGQSGMINAGIFNSYSAVATQMAPVMDIGSSATRMIDNVNLENEAVTGSGDLDAIGWDIAA